MSNTQPAFAGIDVRAHTLSVALSRPGQGVMQATFDNAPRAHKRLLKWLTKGGRMVSVCLEATGRYSLGVALALRRLAELASLPDAMEPPQWGAHAGLDPKPKQSGMANPERRISKTGNKYLRHALYMPAWVACRHEVHVEAFYDKLIARGKKPLQAIVAVMRKLLHAIWGMLRHDQDFEGEKFYRIAPQSP